MTPQAIHKEMKKLVEMRVIKLIGLGWNAHCRLI